MSKKWNGEWVIGKLEGYIRQGLRRVEGYLRRGKYLVDLKGPSRRRLFQIRGCFNWCFKQGRYLIRRNSTHWDWGECNKRRNGYIR